MPKYRVIVYREERPNVWLKELAVNGDAETSIEALGKAYAHKRHPAGKLTVVDPRVKFPHVKVKLTGSDGNVFMVIGKVLEAMHRARVSGRDIGEFKTEATSAKDYDHVIAKVAEWVTVK
jgi:hypothetical protein